jgi:signal transduction histidine kinase
VAFLLPGGVCLGGDARESSTTALRCSPGIARRLPSCATTVFRAALDAVRAMTDNFHAREESQAVGIRETDAQRELDALRLEIEELRASRRRLVLTADADRRGFERALHDGLQQQLVGLAANLQLAAQSVEADPSSALKLLEAMRADLREAL